MSQICTININGLLSFITAPKLPPKYYILIVWCLLLLKYKVEISLWYGTDRPQIVLEIHISLCTTESRAYVLFHETILARWYCNGIIILPINGKLQTHHIKSPIKDTAKRNEFFAFDIVDCSLFNAQLKQQHKYSTFLMQHIVQWSHYAHQRWKRGWAILRASHRIIIYITIIMN